MSEPYRAAPTPPLVWTVKGAVLAVDPATGDLRWRHSVDGLVKRLFAVGEHVALVQGDGLQVLRLDTGELTLTVELPFSASAGIAIPGGLFLAGPEGAAAVGFDGRIRWSAALRWGEGLLDMSRHIVMEDENGLPHWRQEVVGNAPHEHPGLLYDGQVAQPDLDRR
ncbi:MAG TPA: PQQ-binding-like beta-propeller repeat protein [Polyangiaceae bacterium LLY-WYZ-15_(1-7)]|nr:hypothetical protein [Myxococcales bacterium]MAT28314.1 hypothetical protein [Sandaracinus sp.]HJK95058.1 PQQ-binding-like beta-propeller repeat protein [Polyangiaceae bacterium LLY-WYZ-15_(1-7)]MBJ73006.1 hypothetical protein [Sandaracinus sp.]HJL05709.1 PQQ-binding-like beta-propeller repeat protein [Polyangiaceae bacterium LLY-WYZ-15_(1-7)]